MDVQTCGQLILQSLRTDNAIRSAAEAKIQEAKEKCPDQLLLSLCLLIKDPNAPPEVTRSTYNNALKCTNFTLFTRLDYFV